MTTDTSFRMTIKDVFSIKGRGVVVTGLVEDGALNVGDEVYYKGPSGVKKTAVAGLEALGKQITQAEIGDTIGVLLQGLDRAELRKGDVLSGNDADYSWSH